MFDIWQMIFEIYIYLYIIVFISKIYVVVLMAFHFYPEMWGTRTPNSINISSDGLVQPPMLIWIWNDFLLGSHFAEMMGRHCRLFCTQMDIIFWLFFFPERLPWNSQEWLDLRVLKSQFLIIFIICYNLLRIIRKCTLTWMSQKLSKWLMNGLYVITY